MINNYFDNKLIEIIIVNNDIVDNNFLGPFIYFFSMVTSALISFPI